MKFLIMSHSKHPFPPEIGPALVDAMYGWPDRHSAKMEQVWGFAGVQGGGGVLNVTLLEELDQVMTEFPFAPFSETQVIPLTEIRASLDRVKQAMAAMAPGPAGS